VVNHTADEGRGEARVVRRVDPHPQHFQVNRNFHVQGGGREVILGQQDDPSSTFVCAEAMEDAVARYMYGISLDLPRLCDGYNSR